MPDPPPPLLPRAAPVRRLGNEPAMLSAADNRAHSLRSVRLAGSQQAPDSAPAAAKTRRKRRGRPLLPDAERRDYRVRIRLSDEELTALRHKAIAAGLSVAAAARELVVRGEVREATPRDLAQVWALLGKWQGAASRLIAMADRHIGEQDRALISSLRDELRALRLALVGDLGH